MQALHAARRVAAVASLQGAGKERLLAVLSDQRGLCLLPSLGCKGHEDLLQYWLACRSFASETVPPDSRQGPPRIDPDGPVPQTSGPGHLQKSAEPAGPQDAEPAGKNVNTRAKIRRERNTAEAEQGLQAASAPQTAAAAPAEEQPQNPDAAKHQGEVLQQLQSKKNNEASDGAKPASSGKKHSWKHFRENVKAKKAARAAKASAVSAAQTPDASVPLSAPAKPTAINDQTADAKPAVAPQSAASPDSAQPQTSNRPDAAQPQTPEPASWRLLQKQQMKASQKAAAASNPQTQLPTAAGAAAAIQSDPKGDQAQRPGFVGKKGQVGSGSPRPVQAPKRAEGGSRGDPQQQSLTPEDIKKMEDEMRHETRCQIYASRVAAKDLTENDVNRYYQLDTDLMPEAMNQFYENSILENGGCRGLQAEIAYTRSSMVQYRDCIRQLHLKAKSRSHSQLYLEGPIGCGKSIALASLVDWARSQGWLVMYIPSAVALIEGGIYSKGDDGLWDTPEIAKMVLQSMLTNHKKQLQHFKSSSDSSLLQLIEDGLVGTKPDSSSMALANLVTELANTDQGPVMIAVDDYNILYSHANYHEWLNEYHRRQIQPSELRLGAAFRILEHQTPKNGMFVGAASYAGPVSPKLRVPCPKGARHTIPRLSLDEATQQLKYYAVEVAGTFAPDIYNIQSAYYATDGSAKELRQWQTRLMDMPISSQMMEQADQEWIWSDDASQSANQATKLQAGIQ